MSYKIYCCNGMFWVDILFGEFNIENILNARSGIFGFFRLLAIMHDYTTDSKDQQLKVDS